MGKSADADEPTRYVLALFDEVMVRIRTGVASEVRNLGLHGSQGRGGGIGDAAFARPDNGAGGGVDRLVVDVVCVEASHRGPGGTHQARVHGGGEGGQGCLVRLEVRWQGVWPDSSDPEAHDRLSAVLQEGDAFGSLVAGS